MIRMKRIENEIDGIEIELKKEIQKEIDLQRRVVVEAMIRNTNESEQMDQKEE